MTAVRSVTGALVIAGLAFVSLAPVACSSSDDTGGVRSTDAGSTSSSSLSAAFGAKCARCHGAGGLGMGIYPKLPGKPDADAFVALVRAGKDAMPAFTASDISDADLRSDFAYLSGK